MLLCNTIDPRRFLVHSGVLILLLMWHWQGQKRSQRATLSEPTTRTKLELDVESPEEAVVQESGDVH